MPTQIAPAAPFHAPPSLVVDTMSAQIGTSQRALHRKTSFQTSVAPDTCSCPGLPQLLSQALHTHVHSAPHTHCRGTQVDGPTSASPVETTARSGSAPAAPKHARTPTVVHRRRGLVAGVLRRLKAEDVLLRPIGMLHDTQGRRNSSAYTFQMSSVTGAPVCLQRLTAASNF